MSTKEINAEGHISYPGTLRCRSSSTQACLHHKQYKLLGTKVQVLYSIIRELCCNKYSKDRLMLIYSWVGWRWWRRGGVENLGRWKILSFPIEWDRKMNQCPRATNILNPCTFSTRNGILTTSRHYELEKFEIHAP